MVINNFHNKLSELYTAYNQIIKPLIADIESKYQKFPDSIFNEIRAFNDHIARCYVRDITDEKIDREIDKAERHIIRITLDCYKCLVVWFHDYFERFKADFDISFIDNGEFSPYFYNTQAKGIKTTREAKQNESNNKQLAYNNYQKAYNIYSELYIKIEEYLPRIKWAKKVEKNKSKKVLLQSLWLLVASIVLSAVIPWKDIFNWIVLLFKKL